MFNYNLVKIEFVQDKNGYIIMDKNKMIIGKIEIVEYSEKNKSCTFRLHFYIKEDTYEYTTYIIKNFIDMLFDTANLFKINILVGEGVNIQAFVDLNFHMEGILTNNSLIGDRHGNEILLGIDYDIYRNLKRVTTLKLKGENIYLKVLTVNDADKVLKYYKNNKDYLREFEEVKDEGFYTLKRQMIIIRHQYIQFLNGNLVYFGIFKAGNLIGVINLYNILGGMFKDGTIGYSIDEKEQGKGYMKEAVKLVSGYAFNILKLHRLQAATLAYNVKSKAVLKACGFKEIGVSEKYLFINGEWQDQCIFYKLND